MESLQLHPQFSTFQLSLQLTFFLSFFSPSRGKGPLKNSSDVINAAKKIAEAGSRMDKLARAVADQVAPRRRRSTPPVTTHSAGCPPLSDEPEAERILIRSKWAWHIENL